MKFLFLLLFFFSSLAFSQVKDVVDGTYTPGFKSTPNFVKNPFCFANTRNISTSGSGAIARSTSGQLEGAASCSISGTSSGDKVIFGTRTFTQSLKGQNCELTFTYQGDASKWKVYLYDGTNVVGQEVQLKDPGYYPGTSDPVSENFALSFPCKDLSSAITPVFEATASTPLTFKVTNVSTGKNTGINTSALIGPWTSYTPTFTGFGTVSTSNIFWRQVGDSIEIKGYFVSGSSTGVTAQISLPNNYTIKTVTSSGVSTKLGSMIRGNSSTNASKYFFLISPPTLNQSFLNVSFGLYTTSNSPFAPLTASVFAANGEYFSVDASIPVNELSGSTSTYSSQANKFDSSSNPLTHKATAIVSSDTIGTFNTYQYASTSSNTSTICSSAPTQTVSDMAYNGISIQSRPYNATNGCSVPSRFQIKIGNPGDSYKTISVKAFKSTGKSVPGSIDTVFISTLGAGLVFKTYDESTGILTLDAGYSLGGNDTSRRFDFHDGTTQTSAYITVFAQKSIDTMTSSFEGIPVSPGVSKPKECSFIVSGSSTLTRNACSASPCNVLNIVGSCVTSVTRTSSGIYPINFIAGFWSSSSSYVCTKSLTNWLTGTVAAPYDNTEQTATVKTIQVNNTTGNTDASFEVHCFGY